MADVAKGAWLPGQTALHVCTSLQSVPMMRTEEAETAADVVRRALDTLDQRDGAESSRAAADAAVELSAAVADGTVPLSLVLAALQASVVHCSASGANTLPSADAFAEHLRSCADRPSPSEGVFTCVAVHYGIIMIQSLSLSRGHNSSPSFLPLQQGFRGRSSPY